MLFFRVLRKFAISLLLVGLSTAFFTSSILAQRTKLVETLELLGNRRLIQEEILRYIKTRPGQEYNEKQAQEDLQSLLRLGQFNALRTKVSTEVGVRGGVN